MGHQGYLTLPPHLRQQLQVPFFQYFRFRPEHYNVLMLLNNLFIVDESLRPEVFAHHDVTIDGLVLFSFVIVQQCIELNVAI